MDENINILVLNNRCFAQTGGQLSKKPLAQRECRAVSTPAASGSPPWICKPSPAYFHRYTASVNILTDPAGTQRTIREAAAYNGPP